MAEGTDLRQPPHLGIGRTRMDRRSRNPGRPKIHRNYTVEEVARLRGVHKNTVRSWLRQGLPSLKERRPQLILGRDLSEFEANRQQERKRPCGPGQIYCMRCRMPRNPAPGTIRYLPSTTGAGCISATCLDCHSSVFRRISMASLERESANWGITLPKAQEHIVESDQPSVDCDFNRE